MIAGFCLEFGGMVEFWCGWVIGFMVGFDCLIYVCGEIVLKGGVLLLDGGMIVVM